jgi:tRNA threonylcarbamoyl adenosine modification protein YeaZ
VCVGRERPEATSLRLVQHRHGSFLLEQVDEVLAAAGVTLADVGVLAVGTGPGSFTGLRVGLATAKTLAYAGRRRLVGVPSSDALRRAALAAGAPAGAAIVLPAGAHDQYLARAGEEPMLVPPGDLARALGGATPVSVDLGNTLLGAEAAVLGDAAVQGLPAALLSLAAERLTNGHPAQERPLQQRPVVVAGDTVHGRWVGADDAAELVPVYVALPRGAPRTAEELAWSPDLR